MFSDVNRGYPKYDGGCYKKLFEFINYFIDNGKIVGIIGTVFFFLNIVFTCCLTCHPKKSDYFLDKGL